MEWLCRSDGGKGALTAWIGADYRSNGMAPGHGCGGETMGPGSLSQGSGNPGTGILPGDPRRAGGGQKTGGRNDGAAWAFGEKAGTTHHGHGAASQGGSFDPPGRAFHTRDHDRQPGICRRLV